MSKFTVNDYADHCDKYPHTPEEEDRPHADWVTAVYYPLFKRLAEHGHVMGYWDIGARRYWGERNC